MVAQKGKDLLIKLDLSGTGDFETVAGLRATRISFNARPWTSRRSTAVGGWRELLTGRE